MARWIKKGLIFNPKQYSKYSWMSEFAQAPCVIVQEDFIRVYFSTRSKPTNGQYISYSSYVDLDRFDFKKVLKVSKRPILPLGALGSFDEFGTYPVSVIKNDAGKLVCYYAGWTRCYSVPFNTAIGMAISNDEGETFNKFGIGPVLSYSLDEPFIISGPKIRRYQNKWVLWYIAGKNWILDKNKPEPIYTIRMATSKNGIEWKKCEKEIISTKVKEEAQASPDVFFVDGKYHMFFCYRYGVNYRGNEFGYRIGYASSLDMYNWERNDNLAGIDVSDKGWDSEMISYPHVFELDGQIHMFYLGNQVGKEGFGWAQLEEGSLS